MIIQQRAKATGRKDLQDTKRHMDQAYVGTQRLKTATQQLEENATRLVQPILDSVVYWKEKA